MEKRNKLAHYLRTLQDINPDNLILICLDRSEQMLIAILGVLKVGAAYVPINPSYPDERIAYIINDTKAKIILTNDIYQQRLENLVKKLCDRLEVLTIELKACSHS